MILSLNGPVTRVERVGLVAALALATALMWPLRHYLTDDTYIHQQYARHLANGQGLVFNVGERVYGCTSPLWVALIADGMALGIDGLRVARTLGFLATLASIALFFQLMRRTLRTPELRALATLAWAGHAWMLRWSLSGMETPLAVALVLAGFVAFTEGLQWGSRPVRTAALWSLAALTRPEAVFLLGLWTVFLIVDTDSRAGLRRLVFGLVPPLLIYGGWLAFSRLYFGTFWPNTLEAKAAGSEGLAFQLDNLWRQVKIVGATDGVKAAVLIAALVFGARRMWPRHTTAQRMVPWVWLVGVPALYVARGVPVLSRYLLPLLPVMGWLAWRAAEVWWVGEDPSPAQRRRAVVLGVALAALTLFQNLTVYRMQVLPHVESFSEGFRGSLVRWGRWFGDHAPPGAVIATPDIGAIGYFSRHRVVDLAGLVTPQMVPLLRQQPAEDVVRELRFESFARPGFLVDRAPVANDLIARSSFAACLTPLGHASVPNLGIARPGEAVYTFYRVDWAVFDTLRARR
jgi:arabinofuranosyltransferase